MAFQGARAVLAIFNSKSVHVRTIADVELKRAYRRLFRVFCRGVPLLENRNRLNAGATDSFRRRALPSANTRYCGALRAKRASSTPMLS